MEERRMSSRSKVTITLGRRGQVVKSGTSGEMQNSGAKRPMSERLGANVKDSYFYRGQTMNKRQCMESNGLDLGRGFVDQQIEGGDLRLKLIRKGITQKSPTFNGEVDLREKLLRKLPKKPASNYPPIHTMERESERERERQRQRERESGKQRERRREQETNLPKTRVAANRSVDNLPPYPSWSYNARNELDASHRGGHSMTPPLPPPPLNRPYVELGRVGTAATVSSRPSSSGYGLKRGNDLVGGSGVASDYVNNGVLGAGTRKTVLPLSPPQKLVELPATVDELLTSLELEKYAIIFKVEEVDMGALKQMGDSDLKELGIPMGPRKKILLAVRSSAKQRPR